MPTFKGIIDVQAIRQDFPILHQDVFPGVPLAYLDNAATSQKPLSVIEAVRWQSARPSTMKMHASRLPSLLVLPTRVRSSLFATRLRRSISSPTAGAA